MENRIISFLLFFTTILFFAIQIAPRPGIKQDDVKFDAELAEQKRQEVVASDLRASEKGDLAEFLDGRVFSIWLRTSDGRIEMADCLGSRDMPREIEFWAKTVKHVFKFVPSEKYAELAHLQIMCERTK